MLSQFVLLYELIKVEAEKCTNPCSIQIYLYQIYK